MKRVVVVAATVALAGQQVQGFLAAPSAGICRPRVAMGRVSALHMSTKVEEEDDTPQVFRASEIAEENKKNRFQEYFGDKGVLTKEESQSEADERMGPKNYIGLIDGDTFDGGDGQTGCVGEEDNKMDKFEKNEIIAKTLAAKRIKGEAIGGGQSKAKQMNAFGSLSGYADELEEKGMKKIVDGEDKLKVRRQQFENYRNQQELQRMQRAKIQQLDQLAGVSPDETKRGSSRSYMDNLSSGGVKAEVVEVWNKYAPPPAGGKSDGSAWSNVKLTGKEKITDTIMCISKLGRPGYETVQVKNTVMSFEPFHCEFSGDAEGFNVEPKTGTLNRRSGAPIPVTVSFKSNGPGDHRDALLVVETEEDKFLYQIQGRTE